MRQGVSRRNKCFLEPYQEPEGGCMALVTGVVNRAILDYNEKPPSSLLYKSAKSFLKSWNIIK